MYLVLSKACVDLKASKLVANQFSKHIIKKSKKTIKKMKDRRKQTTAHYERVAGKKDGNPWHVSSWKKLIGGLKS